MSAVYVYYKFLKSIEIRSEYKERELFTSDACSPKCGGRELQ
jgi:hypothetical protein